MSVETSSGGEFNNSYEKEAVDIFTKNMYSRFETRDELYVILTNYMVEGRQIDLSVLKKDGIFVIELKKCEYPFHAYENKDWSTTNGEIIGIKGMNPYRQVSDYRHILIDILRRNKDKFTCLKNFNGDKRVRNVKGIVSIYPSLHNDCKNNIPRKSPQGKNINWWFKLCGIGDVDKLIENETYPGVNFSDNELRLIATDLLMMNKPIGNTVKQYSLRDNIIKSTDGLIKMIAKAEKDNESIQRLVNKQESNVNGEQFYFVIEYIVSNYLHAMNNKKAIKLALLAEKFGLNKHRAMKIINEIAANTRKG